MVKGPGKGLTTGNGEIQATLSSKRRSIARHSEVDTMDSFQDGGQMHMNSEHSDFNTGGMEGSYMNPEMNSYGPNTGDQVMGPDNYGRMDGMHPGQMPGYGYNRPGYNTADSGNNMPGSEYNMNYGQYPQNSGARSGYPGVPRPGMGPVRPGMNPNMGMMPQGPYNSNQRMMSGQSISQQSGPTPTLNQLLQTPNAQPRYPGNNYDGYPGPQKGDMTSANGPYGMAPQGWMQNQRGMGNYPPMSMSGQSSFRGQVSQNYNQQGFNQSMPPNSQSQYTGQGSIQQQGQPPGQPPGSSPGQQRPTPQPSPHQQVSPAPSPVQRVTPNPSPGPQRPAPQPSPGQQRTSQPSPSPSQRSSSSQLSPPGSSPGQQNSLPNNTSQQNHQSSPKDSSFEDVKGDNSSLSSRPVASPGSVGSRSNTPASNISGSSPMPPPVQDGNQQNMRMNPSQMSVSGYNQQMMPPPMGPGQMAYNQGNKMGPGGPYYPNSQYPPHSGNYPMRQPGPGMPGYQQNMYNGPSHVQGGPAGAPMYNNMGGGGPGMNRGGYMYGGQSGMMGMNNQYSGPGPNSQPGPPAMNSNNQGANVNGPQGSVSSMGSGNSVVNNSQGQTPIKGAQAAAQAAMAAASASAGAAGRPPSNPGRPNVVNQSPQRMYNPNSMGPHSMPPQSISPLSQMGQMNQMGAYNPMMNNVPHPQNSVSPVPNAMGHSSANMQQGGQPKMHNSSSVNSYGDLSKSKTKSKMGPSMPGSLPPLSGMANSVPGQDSMPPHPSSVPVDMNNIPNTQPLPSTTPTSSLSDASSHSNDSSSMGPVMNNNSGHNNMSGPHTDVNLSTSSMAEAQSSMDLNSSDGKQITTTANTTSVETSTTVTQSITSPVTSISTEAGNSNDSQPLPMEPVSQLQNCIPASMPSPMHSSMGDEPPEKKKKTDGSGVPQLPYARVAPSPGGASVASSGTHEDIDNIGSPGWPGTPKNTGDQMRLYDMGNEMNRRPFLDRLFAFLDEKGAPITSMPVISKQPLDLYRLYLCVQERGGMVEVNKAKKWKEICGLVNISGSASAAFTLKKNYIKFLFGFECRFDRNNMDPNPILAQMETDLEKKRAAKNRNRAPSPAGSQGSQDGMGPNQFMNDPSMGHMGQGMMGNHMMNNMGPMMGPNNMGGPHMGMQGMMGNQPMMGGNSGYMMQGGPNNMMGNNMGPQGSMMGPGMQGPNMMGNMGNMMNPGMMNNMNMPGNMPGNNMMQQPGNMMPGGMIPANNMNQNMMRNNMNQPVPNSGPSNNFPPMGRNGDNSVSCQDPFSDEPFSRGNNSQTSQYSNTLQQNGPAVPQQSNSPMPQVMGGANSQNSMMPSNNTNSMPPNSFNSDMPNNSQSQNSQMGQKPEQKPNVDSSSTSVTMTTASVSSATNTSTISQPNLFSQDSNSSTGMSTDSVSSLGVKSEPGQGGKAEPGQAAQNTNMPQQQMEGGQNNSSQFNNSSAPPTSSANSGRQFPFGDQFTKPERFDTSSPSVSQQQQQQQQPSSQGQMSNPQQSNLNQQTNSPMPQTPMMGQQQQQQQQQQQPNNNMQQGPMNPMMSQGGPPMNTPMSQGPMMNQQPNSSMAPGVMNPNNMPQGPNMNQQNNTSMSQGPINPGMTQGPMMSSQQNAMPQGSINSSMSQGNMMNQQGNNNNNNSQGPPGGQQAMSQGQGGMNQQSNTTMSQGYQNPVMSQGPGMNPNQQGMPGQGQFGNNTPMSQGQMMNNQAPMSQPHSMPMNYPQQGMNQPPHMNAGQQNMDGNYSGRYGPQQHGPDHFNSNYPGNQGYGPRPMMNNDQFQGYPNQQGPYGKPPMNRDMSGGNIYSTPNKRFPDRDQFMSPGYTPQTPMNYGDPNMSYFPTTPQFNEFNMGYQTDRREGPWSPMHQQRGFHNQSQFGNMGMSPSGPPNMSHIQRRMSPDRNRSYTMSPNKMFGNMGMSPSGPPNMSHIQRRMSPDRNRSYTMSPNKMFGNMGMSPSGPPNMSHIQRRMSPDRNRSYTMSPNKMKMSSGMHGAYGKKDHHFPMDTVESTQPLLNKRRRLTKHDIGQVDAWRIMMSLKSGLLAESTWALDTLNVLLYDDSTVAYFGLSHLPGLVEVILDHFRRCLIDMFDMFDETQIGCGHDDFKQNLIRMAILESALENKDKMTSEEREIKRANRTISKMDEDIMEQIVKEKKQLENLEKIEKKEEKVEKKEDKGEKKDDKGEKKEENAEKKDEKEEPAPTEKKEEEVAEQKVEEKTEQSNKEEEMEIDMTHWKNYTYISRHGKEVKLEENSDPNGLLEDKYWDVYCEFGDQSELWEYGKGDVTEHIKTHFENSEEMARCSKRFFRKPMKYKDSKKLKTEKTDSNSKESSSVKCENMDIETNSCSKENQSNIEISANEKTQCSSKIENLKNSENDHSCSTFIDRVTKSELRDNELEKSESNEFLDDKFNIADKYFRDEPRMKLAVKYELLDSDELVQRCKTSFGINTEGERMSVEDESYQRNEPPLCLISEARNEIGRRCVCISNIFRSLSCIPGNDVELSRHAGLVYILGKLLLLHHNHLPRARVRRKFDRDDVDESMVDTSQGVEEWWWDYLNMLRENTLVIFANVCAQLKLDKFPDEICQPVLEGLTHWMVCPSSCASDPLPTVSPASVLSPLRLVLEAMCKLCIHDKNVDMLLATPPYERIVQLFNVLTKLLANKAEQVTVEFSIVLLSELVKGGSSAARGVALQHPCISLLIDFLETAEQKASQVANMRGIQLLRDNPEMMGTSLDMIRRAATVLLHLARVPDNRKLFMHHQSRVLSLVMSQILDQTVATILSDVLYQCSH